MLFYGKEIPTWKANLHTHSTTSDGSFTPSQVAELYENAGYDLIFLSDHQCTNDVTAFADRKIRVYSGIELHPLGPRDIKWHILGLGVPSDFDGYPESAQAAIDAVNAVGGVAFVAHPYWCRFTSQEVMSVHGSAGIEVYNASCRNIAREYNMQLWDEMLDAGELPFAIAVDDMHTPRCLFKGWTMICAEENTETAILSALRNGAFYATQGPEFKKLSFDGRIFEAEFTEVESAILTTNVTCGYFEAIPGCPFTASHKLVTSLRLDVTKLYAGTTIRCQIRDVNGHYAWSNPIRFR